MKKIFLALLFFPLATLCGQEQLVDGVIAVVGKNKVLYSDILTEVFNQKMQNPNVEPASDCQVFENILMSQMLLHQADLDTVEAPVDRVEQMVNQRLDYYIAQLGSQEAFEKYYKKPIKAIRQQMAGGIADQMRIQQVRQTLQTDVKSTLDDVREYFKTIPTDSLPSVEESYQYVVMVVQPTVDQESADAVIEKLNTIRSEVLNKGANFGLKALLYSQDPGSARKRGRYETVRRGQFVKEFEKVAFQMKEGEVSKPFLTQYGYHIVQLHARKGTQLDLSHILISPKISDDQQTKAIDLAQEIRNKLDSNILSPSQIKDYVRYKEVPEKVKVANAMNPQTGELNMTVSSIPFYFKERLPDLEDNTWSEPFYISPDYILDQKYKQYGAVYVIKKVGHTDEHIMSLDLDFDRIQDASLRKKKMDKFKKWLTKKSTETGVYLTEKYRTCDFNYDWKLINKS